MKQTAVEWFFNELYSIRKTIEFELQADAILKAFKQAKEMFEQQIIDAQLSGQRADIEFAHEAKEEAEIYYQETFKK
jgi:hypothetical protein